MKVQWGDKISIGKRFVRRYENHMKKWVAIPFKKDECLFLGIRVLSNGSIRYSYDEGADYRPTEHFKVAFVSPSKRRNPIYVPLDSIWLPKKENPK